MNALRTQYLPTFLSVFAFLIVSGCATTQAPVIEKLDPGTAATITYGRTPLVMSPDTPLNRDNVRDYVQVGALEVNRQGALEYYLWLGISVDKEFGEEDEHPQDFEIIELVSGDRQFQLEVLGWSHDAIGASESVYQKLFATSDDAYYKVTLDQLRILTDVDSLKLRSTGEEPREFISWYRQTTFATEIGDFFNTVSR